MNKKKIISNKKKFVAGIITAAMSIGLLANPIGAFAAESNPLTATFRVGESSYSLNGANTAMDAKTFIENGRTYVPLRYLGNAMGVPNTNIAYDSKVGSATLVLGDKSVICTVGNYKLISNNTPVSMDVKPINTTV